MEATLQCVKEVGALCRKQGVWKEFSVDVTCLTNKVLTAFVPDYLFKGVCMLRVFVC